MMSLSIDSGSDDRDIEAGDDEEEGDEKVDNEKRMKEEEEMKKAKERQAFLENLYVLICMIIIVAMAVVIVIVKVNIFKTDPNITFIPLDQQVFYKFYKGTIVVKIYFLTFRFIAPKCTQAMDLFHVKDMFQPQTGATFPSIELISRGQTILEKKMLMRKRCSRTWLMQKLMNDNFHTQCKSDMSHVSLKIKVVDKIQKFDLTPNILLKLCI